MDRTYFGGTLGRSRGGHNSWEKRIADPVYYRKIGCVLPNVFRYPERNNPYFAEFVGIVLGDGGLTNSQLKITLNREKDFEYVYYVQSLIHRLFGYLPSVHERKDSLATVLTVSGINFVNFLKESGLFVGNKVCQQVGVPSWIQEDLGLSQFCIRGLMDTDGCIFENRYMSHGRWYIYKKLAFSNRSTPLLTFFRNTLVKNGLHPVMYQNKQVRLCSERETLIYLEKIGSSNPRVNQFKSCYNSATRV